MDELADDLDVKRSIQDSVHGFLSFESYVWEIVDTKHFQRLREIKQLGTSYYVWPGASHNRFEHSLGTAHLARQMVEHLKQTQPSLRIDDRDVKCVTLAGLCHDLGHGPWSHVWDSQYIPQALKGRDWQHEAASEMMMDDLVKKHKLSLDPGDVFFIKALISGESSRCPGEKSFLFEIVANKRNGVDVDKFDYMCRDGRAIGKKAESFERLITSARVIENQICYDHKDANQIYEVFHNRFSLHKTIYSHKTAKAIEHMLVDAIIAAEPTLKIANQIEDPDKYIHLTDSIKSRIELEDPSKPGIAEAQAILARVDRRDLYKCVDSKAFMFEDKKSLETYITPKEVVAAAKALLPSQIIANDDDDEAWAEAERVLNPDLKEQLHEEDVIVSLSTMHYGMKDENPLDFIKFYSKRRPNECSRVNKGDLSTLQPSHFAEVQLRIYTKHAQFADLVQAGYRKCLLDIAVYDIDSLALAPVPATVPPLLSPSASQESRGVGDLTTPPPRREQTRIQSFGGKSVEDGALFNAFFGSRRPQTLPSHSRKASLTASQIAMASATASLPSTSTSAAYTTTRDVKSAANESSNSVVDGDADDDAGPRALFPVTSPRSGKRVRGEEKEEAKNIAESALSESPKKQKI